MNEKTLYASEADVRAAAFAFTGDAALSDDVAGLVGEHALLVVTPPCTQRTSKRPCGT